MVGLAAQWHMTGGAWHYPRETGYKRNSLCCPYLQVSLASEWGTDKTHGLEAGKVQRGLLVWIRHWDKRASTRPTDSSLAEPSDACLRAGTSLTLTGLNLDLAGTNDSHGLLIYELHFWSSKPLICMLEQGPFLDAVHFVFFWFGSAAQCGNPLWKPTVPCSTSFLTQGILLVARKHMDH